MAACHPFQHLLQAEVELDGASRWLAKQRAEACLLASVLCMLQVLLIRLDMPVESSIYAAIPGIVHTAPDPPAFGTTRTLRELKSVRRPLQQVPEFHKWL